MKALVGAFNQEKALVGAFSVIVQPVVEPMDRFAALVVAGQGWREIPEINYRIKWSNVLYITLRCRLRT